MEAAVGGGGGGGRRRFCKTSDRIVGRARREQWYGDELGDAGGAEEPPLRVGRRISSSSSSSSITAETARGGTTPGTRTARGFRRAIVVRRDAAAAVEVEGEEYANLCTNCFRCSIFEKEEIRDKECRVCTQLFTLGRYNDGHDYRTTVVCYGCSQRHYMCQMCHCVPVEPANFLRRVRVQDDDNNLL